MSVASEGEMAVGLSAAKADRTGRDEPVDAQQEFWDSWNKMFLDNSRGPTSQRQAEIVAEWLHRLARPRLDILEVGCGSGWMCERLAAFGQVTGTDLSQKVLEAAQQKFPEVHFVAGDFMTLGLPMEAADVVVTLETLAHMADQPAFLHRISSVLRRGGYLMLASQNPLVLGRWDGVAPRAYGQIRHWVGRRDLRRMLERDFIVEQLITVVPFAHGGFLRIVNSPKVNRLVSTVIPQPTLDRWKERAGLGHTIMALARKR